MTDYQAMIDDQSDEAPDPQEIWDMYWAPKILDENGGIDPDKLHQVLADAHENLMDYGVVLSHATFNRINAPGDMPLDEILQTIDDENAYYAKVDLLNTAVSLADGAELPSDVHTLLIASGLTDEDIASEDVAR